MGDWTYDTPWRQGFILTAESAKALGIEHPDTPDKTVVLVVSHDCDLAQLQDKEPVCEAIVGRVIAEARGDFANGKNVRLLHLPLSAGETKIVAEFQMGSKFTIDKNKLADHLPTEKVRPTPDELTILQLWLAARYYRSAFPNEFDRRLKAKKTHEKIGKTLKTKGNHLLAVFFNVDDGKEVDRNGPDDTYTLSIYLLYRSADEPAAYDEAKAAAQEIEEVIKDRFLADKKWQFIELVEIEPISDEAMTVRHARSLKRWHTDHISLAEDPQGPMLTVQDDQRELVINADVFVQKQGILRKDG